MLWGGEGGWRREGGGVGWGDDPYGRRGLLPPLATFPEKAGVFILRSHGLRNRVMGYDSTMPVVRCGCAATSTPGPTLSP